MTYGLDFHRAKNRLYRKKIGTGSGQEPPAAAISGRSSEVRPGMFVKRFLVGAAASTSRRLSSSSSPYPTLAAPFGVDHRGSEDQPEFKPEKVLLLTKVTRYEFERNRFPGCSEETLREKMEKRGSNHDLIRQHHEVHKQVEEVVVRLLEKRRIEVKKCQREAYSDELINWADAVMTTGGDGTFLLAASKITNRHKPLIGINSDPARSEGHLLLPKWYNHRLGHALDALFSGKFRWMYRRRVRVTLTGSPDDLNTSPIELHNQQLQYPEYRFFDFLREKSVKANDHPLSATLKASSSSRESLVGHSGKGAEVDAVDSSSSEKNGQNLPETRTLPVLALNEVFVGESLSSRVSYLEVHFDEDASWIKTRNSGLCVSTGTGSTSWTYNINRMTPQSVESLLRITADCTNHSIDYKDSKLVDMITKRFNSDLRFDPEYDLMAYTIRDPISMLDSGSTSSSFLTALDSHRRPRGKAARINVKSKCFDACLVIDGSLSFKFNDGTRALLEIMPEDALKTVELEAEY